ncbi:methionine synthase (B12-independent) [Paenibacillus cellulosilyticus]|uniref:5-methyltetrahydropteroyltriglutamate--homocysteine methyltransferase n=1 Tax=Paenibacillus cellulosilyticus TaxID=375489 RepID=A0A2V2Z0E2_9BACL|nr:5-methyltetrahydropteroyltriglutamate--homocysteine S-methyltransferase [Paenibacillus cellulosilyticus]PWW08738.1 methionine synthase (B12-independent) [Paenibacillus cellulosilyticus]QKS48300.1 5-methyltetrahydropteroyltriglutamate--homocysteine S-methyltransferase [Paenibacillus cellulosilyticus]
MKTSIIGYPRVGALRELKFASENYFKGTGTLEQLNQTAVELRASHWKLQQAQGIDYIPSNDFSFYDGLLDTACLFNIIPERYRELGLSPLETYFAMARGYQGEHGDVKALAMKKWFNTNYHYMTPEIEDSAAIRLAGTKLFDEFNEAKQLGITTKPVLVGPFTLLKLAKFTGSKQATDFVGAIVEGYKAVLAQLNTLGAEWVQVDEPALVTDLSPEEIALFTELHTQILAAKGGVKVLVQTYFGDVRDCYQTLQSLPFDGIGLDFVEGTQTLALVKQHGFAQGKVLFAGVVNGKNIWKNQYKKTLSLIQAISQHAAQVVLGTSCSLLHVPYTLKNETKLPESTTKYFAFAEEKLQELAELKTIASLEYSKSSPLYIENDKLFSGSRFAGDASVQARAAALTDADFTRLPAFAEREQIQKNKFNLPLLPTTTIGSFPQTADVRANRASFKKGAISEEQYKQFNFDKIAQCIAQQEEIGLDVLVHGEYERNDMVEYFGESLDGFAFTQNAWVQSYGTRCVKPPIIWGDIRRSKPMTVEYSAYAKSLTNKPVKGMLTGPVTILNWSFTREDISLKDSALQIALAIRDEVLDLEANQIDIIQIDEAALREKLPLRQSDWQSEYLSWAIPAFRLTHSGVQSDTQIHTHMCYSQFSDIIRDIDAMDADVITFEASRSDLSIIDSINACGFKTEVGPGVYDIHSPRVPSVDELKQGLGRMLDKIDPAKLWVNPDCGLKTRGEAETWASLKHLIEAAQEVRATL